MVRLDLNKIGEVFYTEFEGLIQVFAFDKETGKYEYLGILDKYFVVNDNNEIPLSECD